jgi:lipopolysaccharide export system permease protein
MKKFNVLVVRSFLQSFFPTFVIVMFILLMQVVWLYVDELVGKGLEWTVIAELMFYFSASLIPQALPLSVLLASIMTFGNLGESYVVGCSQSCWHFYHENIQTHDAGNDWHFTFCLFCF